MSADGGTGMGTTLSLVRTATSGRAVMWDAFSAEFWGMSEHPTTAERPA